MQNSVGSGQLEVVSFGNFIDKWRQWSALEAKKNLKSPNLWWVKGSLKGLKNLWVKKKVWHLTWMPSRPIPPSFLGVLTRDLAMASLPPFHKKEEIGLSIDCKKGCRGEKLNRCKNRGKMFVLSRNIFSCSDRLKRESFSIFPVTFAVMALS